MTIEETIGALFEAKLASVHSEVRRLSGEIDAMRRSLPPALVTMAEASRTLGVSMSTIKRRVKDGSLPVRRVGKGKALRVDLTALHRTDDAEVARLVASVRAGP